MADSNTTNYSLVKPEVGASEDTWGTKLNQNLDTIDSKLDDIEGKSGAATLKHTDSTKLATTSTGVDVTGTVTADGLTVDLGTVTLGGEGVSSAFINAPEQMFFNVDSNNTPEASGYEFGVGRTGSTGGKKRLTIGGDGDVSFYEDTGTTAKMVWDASAESLGIGVAPATALHVQKSIPASTDLDPTLLTLKNSSDGGVSIDMTNGVGGNSRIASEVLSTGSGTDETSLVFSTSNNAVMAEAMRIDSSGNVGIGTSSPASDVAFSGGVKLQTEDDTNTGYSGSGSGRLPSGTQISTRNAVASSSSLSGIGMLNRGPGGASMGSYIGSLSASSGWGASIVFGSTSGSSSHQERARIDSSGNLLVGTTSAGGRVTVVPASAATGIYVQQQSSSKSLVIDQTNSNTTAVDFLWYGSSIGSITNSGGVSTAYNTTSDYRLKENVVPMTDATARVLALKPCKFNFIANPNNTVDGFIAHEAQQVIPEAVHGVKDEVDSEGNPVYQGIDQSKLVPLLTAALQEAITKIEQLEARIETLENK